jgi:cation diffusion facilitator family transporter
MNHETTHVGWTGSHDHVFGQDRPTAHERRTVIVVVLTAVTMVVEIAAGMVYGSMALLADGLHMASHAVALGIAAFAYRYSRQHAADPRFSFGTGKIGALAGYSGAVLLGLFALGMAFESLGRFVNPVAIAIDQALVVAVLGLLVNGVSVLILGLKGQDDNNHGDDGDQDHHRHDHNLRSAYFHVLADALTSVLAIAALLAAKFAGMTWLDALMGIVGALLVTKWSAGLLLQSGRVLLDRQAPGRVLDGIRAEIERLPDTAVADLHVWSIGTGKRAAIIAVETGTPLELDEYRRLLPSNFDLVHVTIEVCPRPTRSRAVEPRGAAG